MVHWGEVLCPRVNLSKNPGNTGDSAVLLSLMGFFSDICLVRLISAASLISNDKDS